MKIKEYGNTKIIILKRTVDKYKVCNPNGKVNEIEMFRLALKQNKLKI